jgi:hypothetical protein
MPGYAAKSHGYQYIVPPRESKPFRGDDRMNGARSDVKATVDVVVSNYSADPQALQQKVLVCVTMVSIWSVVNDPDAVTMPR